MSIEEAVEKRKFLYNEKVKQCFILLTSLQNEIRNISNEEWESKGETIRIEMSRVRAQSQAYTQAIQDFDELLD
jgi:hypothetical protein